MAEMKVPFQAGDLVAGRYRVEALLGQGGFGVVYRAVQVNIGRAVALKVLLAEALAHAEGFARFRREAELAQRLEHPNTVRLYDFGETDKGLPFTAWELLRGRPLDAVLRAEKALALPRVARIGAQVLKALMEAHALGIVHRDIKPGNLFLCEFPGEHDFVKVLDFGIAKSLSSGPGLTRDGAMLGTPSYMAPEQVAGEDVTPSTDLYALGLVMAEALGGRTIFTGDSGLALCMAQLSAAPAPLPESVLRSPLGPVIARAVEKSAAARFPSAAEMLAQVEAVAATLSGSAPLASTAAPAPVRASAPAPAPVTALVPAPAPRPATALVPAPAPAPKPATVPPPPIPPPPASFPTTRVSAPPPSALPVPGPTVTPAPPLQAPFSQGPPSAIPPTLSPVPVDAVPADPARRRLILGAAAVVVVAGVAGAIGYAMNEGPIADRVRPGRPHPAGPLGPPVAQHFSQLTPAQIRARIEDANHRVTTESNSEFMTIWILEPHGDPHGSASMVQLYRFPDALRADAVYKVQKPRGAIARDGNTVLSVMLPQPAAADSLLARIIR